MFLLLALQHTGIELAASWIVYDSVPDAVLCVADIQRGFVDQRIFHFGDIVSRIRERGLCSPNIYRHQVSPVVRGRTGDNPVIIKWEFLCFCQALLSAR